MDRYFTAALDYQGRFFPDVGCRFQHDLLGFAANVAVGFALVWWNARDGVRHVDSSHFWGDGAWETRGHCRVYCSLDTQLICFC